MNKSDLCDSKMPGFKCDSIVVSGMSGRFPKANNLDEFWSNLTKGVDAMCVPGVRWPKGLKTLPKRVGHLDNLDKFDAEFFGINSKEAACMDPQLRMALEVTYEAIIDSGHEADKIGGPQSGLFVSCFMDERVKAIGELPLDLPEYRDNYVERLAYTFNIRGLVSNYDTACSASSSAFTEAYMAIRHGLCDQAIVVCMNICQSFKLTEQFKALKMISSDGICHALDKSASGFARSEGIAAVIIEREKDAQRCYMRVLSSRTNEDGFKPEGITFPSITGQTQLLEKSYQEIGLDPRQIDYVEAHLTGTQAGDAVEGETLYNFFAAKRREPLLIGSLKSNLGHTEGCSGVAAVIKDALIFQNNLIPANLHFHEPNPKVKGLFDGKFKPIVNNTRYTGRYIAMETFGFGGANAHSIFERIGSKSTPDDYILSQGLPRIVCLQARNPDSLRYTQNYLEKNGNRITKPFLHLMENFSKKQRFMMPSRGYTLINSKNNCKTFQHFIGSHGSREQSNVHIVLPSFEEGNITFDPNFSEIPFWSKIVKPLEMLNSSFGLNLSDKIFKLNRNNSSLEYASIFLSNQVILIQLFKCLGIEMQYTNDSKLNCMLNEFIEHKISLEKLFKSCLEFCENNNYHSYGAYDTKNVHHEDNTNAKVIISFGITKSRDDVVLQITEPSEAGNVYISCSSFLKCIGQIYCHGIDVKTGNLYQKVSLPVPIDTLGLHSIMKWDHSRKLYTFMFPDQFNDIKGQNRKYTLRIKEIDDTFYMDHKIDGSPLFPATGYLMLAWNAVAEFNYSKPMRFPVIFKNVKFERATFLTEKDIIFRVEYIPGTGRFAIKESGTAVTSGSIFPLTRNQSTEEFNETIVFPENLSSLILETKDIYKELRTRGYDYGRAFKCIHKADEFGKFSQILWSYPNAGENVGHIDFDSEFFQTWIPFTDSVLQLAILSNRKTRNLLIPVGLESLICDPERMLQTIEKQNNGQILFDARHDFDTNTVITNGLKVKGLIGSKKTRKGQQVQLEKCQFVPYNDIITSGKIQISRIVQYQRDCEILEEAVGELRKYGHQTRILAENIEQLSNQYSKDNLEYSMLNEHINCLNGLNAKMDHSCDLIIGKDTQLYLSERFLRPFVNTIFTETPRRKQITILERNDTKLFLTMELIKAFDYLAIDATDYTILQSSAQDDISKPSGVLCEVKDLASGQYKLPSNKLIELLVYKISSAQLFEQEINQFLEKMSKNGVILTVFMEKNPSSVKDDDSFNLISSTLVMEKMASHGWIVLQERTMDLGIKSCIGLLFRKSFDSSAIKDHVVKVESYDYSWLDGLKKLVNVKSEDRIWLVSNEKDSNGLAGLRRCLAQEPIGDRVHCLANRSGSGDFGLDFTKIDFNSPPFDLISKKNLKMNFYDSEHGWGDYNFFSFEEKCATFETTKNAFLQVLTPGDLTSLTWTESEVDFNCKDKIIIDINYAALNFRDIMLATGRLTTVSAINSQGVQSSVSVGLEYSGINVKTGERIMGILPDRGIATKACIRENAFIWKVPSDWSLEEAATVPTVYATVVYALFLRGNIMRNESVLIHAGSGGIGISAINICLSLGCKIFTTVGTKEKREFVKKMFPSLTDSEIFNSRDTTFEEKIMRATNGQGVDIILNSLSDEKLQASLRCLAPGGRFLEIGKYDMVQDSRVELGWLDEGRSFQGVCLDQLFPTDANKQDPEAAKQISRLITQLIDEKVIKPLPRVCFEKDEIEEAFRFMANGKHMGKVLIKILEENGNKNEIESKVNAMKVVKFSPDKVYIIAGGFGGIGLELSLWMASKGAKHIVLNSRSGPKVPYHHYCLSKLKEQGVDVVISTEDLTNHGGVQKLIKSCSLPISGFFNSAMVLHDALFMDQTITNFEKVCSPKINITANFDQVTRKHCPELEYFVVFSSVACGRGNPGQTNYGLANSFMESICEKRRRDGLHGLAIEWGAVGDVGYVADNWGDGDIRIRDTVPQRLNSILATLEKFLLTSESVVSSLTPVETFRDKSLGSSSLVKDITHVFQIKDTSAIDPETTLADLGMDSLMGIEIQQAIERRYNLSLNAKDIRSLTWDDVLNFENRFVNNNVEPPKSNVEKSSTETESQKSVGSKKFELQTESMIIIKEGTNDNQSVTLILPPITNDWDALKLIANHLPGRVYGLNWTEELIQFTEAEKVAAYFVPLICKQITGSFNLIAYSYGSFIGSYIAQQLEGIPGAPKTRKVIFFDAEITAAREAAQLALDSVVPSSILYLALQDYLSNISLEDIGKRFAQSENGDKTEIIRSLFADNGYSTELVEQGVTLVKILDSNVLVTQNLKSQLPKVDRPYLNIKSTKSSILFKSKVNQEKVENEYYLEGYHHDYIENNLNQIIELVTNFLK